MLRWRRKHYNRGFTLIEVLIALALSVLLVALLFSALHTYTLGATVAVEQVAGKQLAESIYQFIGGQLREAVPLILNTSRERDVLFYGDERKIVYIGHIPRHRSAGGLHKNSLVVSGTPPRQTLTFSYERLVIDDRFDRKAFIAEDTGTPHTLGETVSSIEFSYFGAVKLHEDPEWFGEWQVQDRLPELVRIRIESTSATRSLDFVVPIYTNAPIKHIASPTGRRGDPSPNELSQNQAEAPIR